MKILLVFLSCSAVLLAMATAEQKLSWERPVIIGASLSDGFHLSDMGLPFVSQRSKKLGLHHHLQASLKVKHGPILNLGSNWTFLATEAKGKYQIKKAQQAKPTVVFAIDYLFWYLCAEPRHRGPGFQEMKRLEFFEVGLAHLAKLKCPVVLGNIPDARSSVGKVLSRKQYPGSELIKKANTRLSAWLKKHPNFVLLDLHRFHQGASRNEKMEVLGETIPEGKARELYLQWDRLHPTLEGVRTIAKVALEVLEKHAEN